MKPLPLGVISTLPRTASVVLASLIILGFSTPAWAGFEDERKRFLDRNDYVGAFRLTKKYAARGNPKAQVELTTYYL